MCAGFTPNAHDAPCRRRASEFEKKTKGTANGFPEAREILAAARVFVPLRRVGCFAVTAAAGSTCCFVAAAAAAAEGAETAVPWLVIVGHFYCV